jgi:hypothetical protein
MVLENIVLDTAEIRGIVDARAGLFYPLELPAGS